MADHDVISDQSVHMGEGFTPIVRLETFGQTSGLPHLYLKDEPIDPTRSFNACGASMALSRYRELGVTGWLFSALATLRPPDACTGNVVASMFIPPCTMMVSAPPCWNAWHPAQRSNFSWAEIRRAQPR
ncbi:MAG: hypothetical protein H2042_10995 [Rhizobiales bacterium]|nr:hypothetical protein [Hyphomicrobiales bacterium]